MATDLPIEFDFTVADAQAGPISRKVSQSLRSLGLKNIFGLFEIVLEKL